MAPSLEQLGIDRLTNLERLDLIERIWDSLPPGLTPEEVPAWHLEILERRLAEAQVNPGAGLPWREALADIKRRA